MKDTIRRKMLNKRLNMKDDEVQFLSNIITEKLKSLTIWKNTETTALYWPIKGEVNIKNLSYWLKEKGKTVYLPKIKGDTLMFGLYSEKDLVEGKFGIKEPREADIPMEHIEVFVIPGIAFDFDGYRLGFGKGFYDKLISRKKAYQCFIGVCYEFQLLERLPRDIWDEKVDIVVTERSLVFIPTKFQLEVRP